MSDAEDLQDLYSKTRAQRKLGRRLSGDQLIHVVNEIRYARLVTNTSIGDLAKKYDMHPNVVHRIGAGLSFKEVPFDARMRGAIDAIKARIAGSKA